MDGEKNMLSETEQKTLNNLQTMVNNGNQLNAQDQATFERLVAKQQGRPDPAVVPASNPATQNQNNTPNMSNVVDTPGNQTRETTEKR